MPISRERAQALGRIGGLRRAALAPDMSALTEAARAGAWQRYVDQVRAALPGLTDEADISRRADMLRRADMQAMALKSASAQSRAAEAERRAEAAEAKLAEALDATGLPDAGFGGGYDHSAA